MSSRQEKFDKERKKMLASMGMEQNEPEIEVEEIENDNSRIEITPEKVKSESDVLFDDAFQSKD